ncbi:hypothetical protein G9A89_011394 [Geosiphon pyriformis]|nr:hypothetical protein G9A89_011394 [Geosiphon pyriformis]
MSANAAIFSNKFAASMKFLNLDAIWNTICKIMFKGFDDVFTKESLRFHKLELLVSKIVRVLHKENIVDFSAGSDHICSAFFGARRFYHIAKLAESLRAKEANIRSAINRRIKSFKVNKSYTIRSVLEYSFRKVAFNHLVINNELILESDLVKSKTRKYGVIDDISDNWHHQYQLLEYVFDKAFFGIMCSIKVDELVNVVFDLPDGKAAGLLGHCDKTVLDMLLVLLNFCLSSELGVLTNTHPIALIETACKILFKILSDRISLACNTFDVLYGDNFSVLKSIMTQSFIFTIGSKLWLVLQDMQKAYDLVGWKHLKRSLVRIKMCGKFIQFFSSIYEDCTNHVITDFGLMSGYCVHDGLDQEEIFFPLSVGSSQSTIQHILNITSKFFQIKDISINNDKMVVISINSRVSNSSLSISRSLISIAKKSDLAKANSDVCFFTNLILRKAILDKQLFYRTQFSFVSVGMCNKWDAFESKVASLVNFVNFDGILGYLFSHRFHDLQVLCWCSVYLLSSPVHVCVSASNNFLIGMIHILLNCNLSLGGFLASFFWFCSGILMSAYDVAFVDQLWNSYGAFKISATFLNGMAPSSAHSLVLSKVGFLNILNSSDFASVYRSLKDLGIVGCKASAAAFFEDINLSLGIGVSGLMLSTMAELQAIALFLECILMSSSVYLFLDSQSALDACKSELGLYKVKGHSGISENEHANVIAGAVFLSSWCLPPHLDEHFIVADGSNISGNSKHFIHDIIILFVMHAGRLVICFLRSIDSARHWCGILIYTWPLVLPASPWLLPVVIRKCLYNKHYLSVLCLYCGNMKVLDYVFFSLSGFSYSFLSVLQLLSSCVSDFSVSITFYKGFVFDGWFCETIFVFHDFKIASSKIVKFMHSLGFVFRNNIWMVCAKHCAYMKKARLISLDGLALVLIFGLILRLLAGVVKLLGITKTIDVHFGFCKSCLFFLGISDSVSVHITA